MDYKTLTSRRKIAESLASTGLLIICISMIVPFGFLLNINLLVIFKWVYAAGALIYIIGRVIPVNAPADSHRLRRMRRMEAWGGIAFVIAAAFWFYNEARFSTHFAGALTILRETILFTLVGAAIQIVAAAMITRQTKKENGRTTENISDK